MAIINKILAVDDSSTMLRIVVNTLNKAGYSNIITAENGQDALMKLMENPDVSLILSDWNMPEMKGLDLLRAVRTDEKFKGIPFIMVTSRNVKEDILEAVKAGANDYLVKPFTVESLKEKMDRLK
jgi:two-component system chemotaxis response regulator CheY